MVWPADYHMHTPLCRHATGEPIEFAAHAVAAGLHEIGFSDHSPMARDDFDNWRMRLDQLDDYVARVRQAQAAHPQLTIKLALEVDYIPGHEGWIEKLARRHPWDYFIGSVHYVAEGWDVDNPEKLDNWKTRDPFDIWHTYFDRLTQAAGSGLFQIIGHADLPKKFGHPQPPGCGPVIAGFLRAAKTADVAIELNTAGLRKPCREIYPSASLLRQAAALQIPITFGSDAHAPGEVGADFAAALELARQCGYQEYCTFTQRQRSFQRLL